MTNTSTSQASTHQRQDIQQVVTDTIIDQLEKGTVPWLKPFAEKGSAPFDIPFNPMTKSRYRGVNIILLWSSCIRNGLTTQEWGSFNQWKSKKEKVRKGEKGTLVVYYDTFEKETEDQIQKIPFLKHYYVFNKCQLESYEYVDPNTVFDPDAPCYDQVIEEIDEFVGATDAIVESHEGGAYYNITSDKILMPFHENFQDTVRNTAQEGFYSTLFHELTHWTGAKHRLDRINHRKFGDQNYATEELVAEFGAAFLCAGFGLGTLDKGNHAAYIENWLEVLRNDKSILFTAAGGASKAIDYLHKLQPVTT